MEITETAEGSDHDIGEIKWLQTSGEPTMC